jgi:xylulokinase
VSLDGDVLDYELHSVETTYTGDGGATQDPVEWWRLICESTQRLMSRPDVTKERVRAVAVTGQYASTVPVDAHGVPTGPCLMWLDTRGREFSRRVIGGPIEGYNPRKMLPFVRKSGGGPSPAGADPIGQILYLMNREPEVLAATRWMMEPVDYLTMRFTGVASATHASRLASWLTDNRYLTRYEYDDQLLKIVGVDPRLLPPLQPIGTVVGTVAREVAEGLGLSSDTVVITGVPDLHAAAIGSGGTGLYQAHLALSTTSWISCPVPKKKTDALHSIAAIPGLTNDSYLIIDNQETGAKSLEWLRTLLAGSATPMRYDEMTALAATSTPGANGALFTPWLAGERSPIGNKHLRGGFTNLSLTTTTADLIRAVLEGVAANSAWLLGYVEKFAGRELTPLRLLGGGAQSAEWCQIYADALARDVEQVPDAMVAQLRGAALLAAVNMGRLRLDDVAGCGPTVARSARMPRSRISTPPDEAVPEPLHPRQEVVPIRQLTDDPRPRSVLRCRHRLLRCSHAMFVGRRRRDAAPTTTRSGACRSTTTRNSSNCSPSKEPRPGSAG